jgi:tetratricopeptide (TPR) repeat protein
MNNLARAVASAGETAGAISLTEAALALCVAIGDRHREAALHNNLADLLRASGRREEALEHLKTAVAIFSDVGDPGALEPGKWRMATW